MKNMVFGLSILASHMQEKHSTEKYFGDSCATDKEGNIIFQKCFICGEVLIGTEEEKKTGKMLL